ncbi:MAG TPA: tetratricopeptide repeat protein [Steroidobacteraceae bacterium]|nr:tetratricopeptide repeat protein [Steroidobacteraceae bacterium]
MRTARFVLSAALAAGSVVGVTAALLVPATAMAEQKVGATVGKYLKTAQEAMQKKKWDQALAAIKQAQAVDTKTPFEQYKINELLWYVYLQQGRNLDAARLLEEQMNSGMMPAGEKVERTKTLAQLYFRAGNYGRAIQYANQYLKSAPGSQDMQLLVAQSYYQQKDYKNAIAAADRMTKGGGRPSEDVLQLMLRSSYEINDKEGTRKALELLLKYYPSPDTWARLLDGYIAQTKHDDELLSLYRLAEDVGALNKARQYTDMSQGLVVAGFAIEGQRIIEQGLAASVFQGEELSRAQRTLESAKRRADAERQQLPKAAAALAAAATGPQAFAVGKLYFSAADYPNAVLALNKAIAKGGLPDADSAENLLGIALARQGKAADAKKAFLGIKDPKFEEVARLWIIKVGG